MPKPIGRPFPVKDVNELYGELLLQVNRPKEAIAWFDSIADTHARTEAGRCSAWRGRIEIQEMPRTRRRPTRDS